MFDLESRILIGLGYKNIIFFDLVNPEKEPFFYKINTEIYEKVVDVCMSSKSEKMNDWNLLIAAKNLHMNELEVFSPIKHENGGKWLNEINMEKIEKCSVKKIYFRNDPTNFF